MSCVEGGRQDAAFVYYVNHQLHNLQSVQAHSYPVYAISKLAMPLQPLIEMQQCKTQSYSFAVMKAWQK